MTILPFTLSILLLGSTYCYQVDHFIILKAPYPTGQPACLEEQNHDQILVITPEFCATCRSSCVNTQVDSAGELDELVGAQGPGKRYNAESDEAPTPPKATYSTSCSSLRGLFHKIYGSVYGDDAGSGSGTIRASKAPTQGQDSGNLFLKISHRLLPLLSAI